MAITGWKPLGAASVIDLGLGTDAYKWASWTQPNLASQDGIWAQSNTISASGNKTDRGVATGFDFSEIPSDATIDGIEVQAYCETSNKNRNCFCNEAHLTLDGTSIAGNNLADTTRFAQNTPAVLTMGGAAELWGLTPTPATVQSASFGVTLRFQHDASGGTAVRVDMVEMRVHYTPAGGSGGGGGGSGGGGGGFTAGSTIGVDCGLWATSGSATFEIVERLRDGVAIPSSGGATYVLQTADEGAVVTTRLRVVDQGNSTTIDIQPN